MATDAFQFSVVTDPERMERARQLVEALGRALPAETTPERIDKAAQCAAMYLRKAIRYGYVFKVIKELQIHNQKLPYEQRLALRFFATVDQFADTGDTNGGYAARPRAVKFTAANLSTLLAKDRVLDLALLPQVVVMCDVIVGPGPLLERSVRHFCDDELFVPISDNDTLRRKFGVHTMDATSVSKPHLFLQAVAKEGLRSWKDIERLWAAHVHICAAAGCRRYGVDLTKCGGCHARSTDAPHYCSLTCQAIHWRSEHRRDCVRMDK